MMREMSREGGLSRLCGKEKRKASHVEKEEEKEEERERGMCNNNTTFAGYSYIYVSHML